MKFIKYTITMLFFSTTVFSQSYFKKEIDLDYNHIISNIVICPNSNTFSVGGYIYEPPFEVVPIQGYILEFTIGGNVKNSYIHSEPNYHNQFFDIVCKNDYYAIVGFRGNYDVKQNSFLKLIDISGEELFYYYSDTIDHIPRFKKVITDNEGSFIASGYTENINTKKWNPYLIKLDAQANFLWDTTYLDIPSHAWIQDIALSSDGGLYLFMTIGSSQFSSDALLMKTDSLGNQEWGKIFNYAAEDAAGKILVSKEGGFLVSLTALFGKKRIVKLDEDRNVEFIIDHLFTDQYIADVVQLEDSTYVIMGSIDTYGNSWEDKTDIQLVKIDHKGNVLWNRIYEDEDYDAAKSMVVTPDGGFMLACNKDVGPVDKIYLIKTNCMGLLTEPEASFTYEEAAGEVTFTNTSLYVYPDSIDGGYYIWDFGDGSAVSNEVNPVHAYSEEGEYQVKLMGIVCSDTSVYEQTVSVMTTSVGSLSASPSLGEALRVFPNPVDGDVLYFEIGGGLPLRPADTSPEGRILIYNTLGQLVLQSPFKNKVDVDALPDGVYFVVVEIGGERVVEKVLIND